MCLPIVFQQCDFDFAGNWHAEAVEEYEEEDDHCVLMFDYKVHTSRKNCTIKRALSKGDCDGLRAASLNNDWTSMLQQHDGNVESMWQLFKGNWKLNEISMYLQPTILILRKNLGYVHLILSLDIEFRTNIVCEKKYMRSCDPIVFKHCINLHKMQFARTLKKD